MESHDTGASVRLTTLLMLAMMRVLMMKMPVLVEIAALILRTRMLCLSDGLSASIARNDDAGEHEEPCRRSSRYW